MAEYPVQLLEPNFEIVTQLTLWGDRPPPQRFVLKLHEATRLHYYFRLELFGRLFSLAINDVEDCWLKQVRAVRVSDHDPKYLLSERCVPAGQYGAGPMFVWDHGHYHTRTRSSEDVYRQLLGGSLEIELRGIRINGRVLISGKGTEWQVKWLSGDLPEQSKCSVLTGRTLQEIREPRPYDPQPSRLWLEWSGFYTDLIVDPQVAVKKGKVLDMNVEAESRGVFVGMRLHHVLPLVPGCQVKEFAPEPAKQEVWLNCLLDYSDTIQPFDWHCAAADLSPHPNPYDISQKLTSSLATKPFGRLSYGTGPSVWIAQLAAQQKTPYRYTRDVANELAGQPVSNLLCLSEQERDRLQSLGFQTIGEVASISTETLSTQFGNTAYSIRLAALGKTRDEVQPLYPPTGVTKSFIFSEPVNDSLSLQHAITKLTEYLTSKIGGRQAGLVILTAQLEDGSQKTLSRPYNRPVHTGQRIHASLSYLAEEIQKECPGIVRVVARLDKLEPLKSSQQDVYLAVNRTSSEATLASLRESMGEQSVVLASKIERPRREQVLKAWRNATGWH